MQSGRKRLERRGTRRKAGRLGEDAGGRADIQDIATEDLDQF
jgi:hypothetical protein